MNYDTVVRRGETDKPAIIFVHGLGMDKGIWVTPEESRVLGGSFPISVLVSGKPKPDAPDGAGGEPITQKLSLGVPPTGLMTLFHDLGEQGFTVITWSQQRPSAGIDIAVSELSGIISLHEDLCRSGIVLIGHSRGGLIARRYLSRGVRGIRCLITLATPHRGSRMAQWAGYLSPLASALSPFLSDAEKGTLTYTIKKIAGFLTSRAVKELLPDSPFFRSLDERSSDDVPSLSAGGTCPTLLSVYRLVFKAEGRTDLLTSVQKIFSVPDILGKIVPDRLLPDEMKSGKGDGLVSVESSMLPRAREHRVYEVNHAAILFDAAVRADIKDFLDKMG